jgi:outer membrane lipoprotein LolB
MDEMVRRARASTDPPSYQSRGPVKFPADTCKYLLWLLFFLALGGCATLPRSAPAEGGFHLRGKLGVLYGDESFSAQFLWRQQAEAFTIDLWGPLGQGRVQLIGTDRRLALREGDGTLISEGPPAAVMRAHLGWTLPLEVLPQWVRGRPAPGRPVTDRALDENGQLTAFRQLGWQVTLERYRQVAAEADDDPESVPADPVALPHRVTAEREGYRVRLAIADWRVR